jgi:uncharacterized repeat protein (TIGR03803 family)
MPRHLPRSAALLAAIGALVAASDHTQTNPEPPTPVGRVCVPRSFGAPGKFEPIWFLNQGAIAVGLDSNLYTTSPSGGALGIGTVLRISPSGSFHVLFDFDGANGAGPQGGLTDGGDGWFYGTTYGGGPSGAGVIFRIRPTDARPQILYRFRNGDVRGLLPDCPDHRCPYTPRQRADIAAGYPNSPPVRAPNGTLYGVTTYSNNQMFGVLWSMAPPYDSTTFHAVCIFDQRLKADTAMAQFVCKANIAVPNSLVLGSNGALYGTTLGGYGTVFRATTGGDMSVLHEFKLSDGSKPYNLMQASDGNLYGTTANGGSINVGTVFRVTPGAIFGGFETMSDLNFGNYQLKVTPLGLNPIATLVEATAETSATSGPVHFLYGTTKFGGKNGRGVIFRSPLDGGQNDFRVVHDFDLYTTGRSSVTPMVLGPNGLLYGMTYQGGTYASGNFYTLDPRVPPDPVRVLASAGRDTAQKLGVIGSHDAALTGGVLAKDDKGVLIKDSIVTIWTGSTAVQPGNPNSTTGGIIVQARCPNPHIVQFIYRERIKPGPGDVHIPGTSIPSSGSYPLTVSLSDIKWHTDVPLEKDMSLFGHWNAYLEQALGAAHIALPSVAAIFDKPSFGKLENPNAAEGSYPLSGQNPDPKLSETWRATLVDYVFCNCQLAREAHWAREVVGGKAYFAHMSVTVPAADKLQWINEQLRKDGYQAVP